MWSRVNEGSPEALAGVRRLGLRRAVVSNSDGRAEQHIRDWGVLGELEFVIDSQLVGVAKPDPRIFQLALDRMGLAAERVLYVGDVRCCDVVEMLPAFHARYSATERQYRYLVGTDRDAAGPFRYNREWAIDRQLDVGNLNAEAASVVGDHAFLAFAVKGTAPAGDDHHCEVRECHWEHRAGGLALVIGANRFLHHMVRFLVGTMVDVGLGRRPPGLEERKLRSRLDRRRR